jgi:hypothetical protein
MEEKKENIYIVKEGLTLGEKKTKKKKEEIFFKKKR